MKRKSLLLTVMMLLMLTACAPAADDAGEEQPTPTLEVTTSTPTPTPEVTPEPEPTDTEGDATFTFFVEGMEQTVSAKKHNSTMGYSMVYDPSVLRFEKAENSDSYIGADSTNLPIVKITISKSDMSFDQTVAAWKKTGAEAVDYMKLDGCETGVLHYAESLAYDAKVITCYVVQAGADVFVIETHYFTEAAEGAGTRMAQMVHTIAFADVPEAKELKIMFRDKEMKDFSSVIGDVTTLRVGAETGAAVRDVKWTSSDEKVCTVTDNDGTCDVEIVGEGVATVTASCGDLTASTVVRGKKSW